jgi:hypothetical protein
MDVNNHLKNELQKNSNIDIDKIANRNEILGMGDDELCSRIIAITQAYRQERVQNEKLTKILKESQRDIAGRQNILQRLDKTRSLVSDSSKKISMYLDEYNKIGLYKSAIKKQETMILRLEKVLHSAAIDTQSIRSAGDRFLSLKEQNAQLKGRLRNFTSYNKPEALMEIKTIIKRLDGEIEAARGRLRDVRPTTSYAYNLENMKLENEIKLKKLGAQEDAIEGKLIGLGQDHGREKARLTSLVMEKDAMLKALMNGF